MKKFYIGNFLISIVTICCLFAFTACGASYTLTYSVSDGGYIYGRTNQKISSNKNGSQVIAVPNNGYVFTGWSDGMLGTHRKETKLDTDKLLRAEFSEINSVEKATYKILMLFVTEISDVVLEGEDGNSYEVNRRMSEGEKAACENLSVLFADYLNNIMDGLPIQFEVDTYFTTIPIEQDSFKQERVAVRDGSVRMSYFVSAEKIPEVGEKLSQYGSIITSMYLGENSQGILGDIAALGQKKYACVYYDPWGIENLLEVSLYRDLLLYRYAHEFTHTVEYNFRGIIHDYHDALNRVASFEVDYMTKSYLRHEAIIDGIRVGIPYSAWKSLQL